MKAADLSPVDALTGTVARCRRRAVITLFVRYSAAASALALAVLATVQWVRPDVSSMWAAVAVAIGIGTGAVAAAWRRPSIRAVASEIDRHLRLEDTVVAAIQVHQGTAAVGPLIVRQAADRTAKVDVRAIYPLQLRQPAALLGAAIVLMIAAIVPRGGEIVASGDGRGMQGGDTGAGAPTAAPARPGQQGQSQTSDRTAPGSMVQAAPPDKSQETSQAARDRQEPRESSPSGQSADARPDGDANSIEARTTTVPNGEQRGAGVADSAAGNRGTQGQARGSARADAGNGTGGSGSGSARAAGAGGVRGGTLSSGTTAAPATLTNAQTEQYELARRRAEAAIVRGDIPPEWRSYVREYFRAITR